MQTNIDKLLEVHSGFQQALKDLPQYVFTLVSNNYFYFVNVIINLIFKGILMPELVQHFYKWQHNLNQFMNHMQKRIQNVFKR